MIPPESPSAPSPRGEHTFAARRQGRLRRLPGVSSRGGASSGSCGFWLAGAFLCLALSGCTVIAVTGTAISVTAGAVGLAADAAIGTAKIVGKGVGKAADALMDDDPPDASGVNIRYRDPSATAPAAAEMPATAANTTPVTPSDGLPPQY